MQIIINNEKYKTYPLDLKGIVVQVMVHLIIRTEKKVAKSQDYLVTRGHSCDMKVKSLQREI